MPRRRATVRHAGSAPPQGATWPPQGTALVDALIALHHPARRRLYEMLSTDGPASVGQLAGRAGLQPGSVSHHLKALHRAGFIEPAPELATDTRQSWWRGIRRRFSWSVETFPAGTVAHDVAELAEQANLEHHVRTTVVWMRDRQALPAPWDTIGHSTENLVPATAAQVEQLTEQLDALLREWYAACLADAESRADVERRPVRVLARIFPSDPAAS